MPLQMLSQKLAGKDIYNFCVNITADNVKVLNPQISIEVSNKPERVLNMPADEIDLGDASYYKSFLFCKEKKQDTLTTDLKAEFNKAALAVHSSVTMKVEPTDKKSGFTVLFNGKPCKDDEITFDPSMKQSSLSIIFDKDSKTGKRYFRLAPDASSINQLERINDNPAREYELTLRAHYAVDGNPLKIGLIWTIIIVVVLIIIIYIVGHLSTQTIKGLNYITISYPYSDSIRIKNAKRVIFTKKQQKQNVLDRFFTGKIQYFYNDNWEEDWEIRPKEQGSAHAYFSGNYEIIPDNDDVLDNCTTESYTITHCDTKKKYIISLQ
jgi:hypothetical protein